MSEFTGHWYQRSDHAGLGRRLLAVFVDALVFLLPLVLLSWVARLRNPHATTQPVKLVHPELAAMIAGGLGLVVLVVFAAYHVGLRRTAGGTLGYRVAGLRLESVRTPRPTWGGLLRRFLLSMIVPGFFLGLLVLVFMNADPQSAGKTAPPSRPAQLIAGAIFAAILLMTYWPVIWEPRRRAIHDKWSGTWVVRASARPAGRGHVMIKPLMLGPLLLPYWDVEPETPATDGPSA